MNDNLRKEAFPLVLLAHARPDRLNITLTSLRAVRGVDASRVFVLQDGSDEAVAAVVHASGFRRIPLPGGRPHRAHREGQSDKSGSEIARAYRRALSHTFDVLTDDEAIVVVEDDLLFSPDLMEYFLAGYHVMRADSTLWCVSAWNDNGFDGLVGDPKRLLRTGWFPGLGWLLTRSLYKGQLESAWPDEHWDHWMRSEVVHRTSRGRECLIPQVPRTYHHGARGTFMSPVLHQQFFAQIAYSTDPSIRWPPSEWGALRARYTSSQYEARLRRRISAARPILDLRELLAANGSGVAGGDGGTLALWYSQPPRSASVAVYKELATLLGLWHELRRSAHTGVHEMWCAGATRLLLVNMVYGPDAKPSPYMDLAPPPSHIFRTAGGLKAAAKKAFKSLGLEEQNNVCRRRVTKSKTKSTRSLRSGTAVDD